MSEEIELKPCPFCGGKAEIVRIGNSKRSMIYACLECGANLETSEECIDYNCFWNTRHEPELDRLRDDLDKLKIAITGSKPEEEEFAKSIRIDELLAFIRIDRLTKKTLESKVEKFEKAQEWINVDDLLPEVDKAVILLCYDGILNISYSRISYGDIIGHDIGDRYYLSCETNCVIKNVTHWQPLPQPPEDK